LTGHPAVAAAAVPCPTGLVMVVTVPIFHVPDCVAASTPVESLDSVTRAALADVPLPIVTGWTVSGLVDGDPAVATGPQVAAADGSQMTCCAMNWDDALVVTTNVLVAPVESSTVMVLAPANARLGIRHRIAASRERLMAWSPSFHPDGLPA